MLTRLSVIGEMERHTVLKEGQQRGALNSKGLIGVVVLATVLMASLAAAQPVTSVVLLGAAMVLWFILSAPSGVILAALIGVFAFVPMHYMPLPQPFGTITPTLLAVVAVAVLRPTHPKSWLPKTAYLFGGAFIVYLVILAFLGSSASIQYTLAWTVAISIALVVAPLSVGKAADLQTVLGALFVTGLILATYGFIEFALMANPLADFFSSSSSALTQKWGVYRIMTTLGHPLLNATFFALVAVSSFASFILARGRLSIFAFAMSAGAVLLTSSRGGLVALGLGCAVALLLVFRRLNGHRILRIMVLAVPIILGLALSLASSVEARSNTSEGQGSAGLRLAYMHLVPTLLRATGFLGSGAATSDSVLKEFGGGLARYPLESSLAQAIVSFGVPGTIFLAMFVLIVVGATLRRGAIVGPSMLAAYVVAASGYNLLEAYPGALLLPMMCLMVCIMEAERGSACVDLRKGGSPLRLSSSHVSEVK